MAKEQLDISSLALDRTPTISATKAPSLQHKKRWLSRYALPVGVLLGFAMLLFAAAGSRFMPARSVTVVPVIVKRAELQQAGTTLFQAPGWIEPRPTAISVAAMTHGVIEELMVVGGQTVQKGEPIARLVSIDAELVLEQAKNALAIREGELNRAKAELSAAAHSLRQSRALENSTGRCNEQFDEIKNRVSQTALPYQVCRIER